MTISDATDGFQTFDGDGATTVFNYAKRVYGAAHLTVILRAADGTETLLTILTHYTASINPGGTGAVVTMLVAPAAGETLLVDRATPAANELDLVDQQRFPSDSVETLFDKVVMMVGDLSRQLGRALKLPRGETAAQLPPAAARADKLLAFDGAGDPFALAQGEMDVVVLAEGHADAAAASAVTAGAQAALAGLAKDAALDAQLAAEDARDQAEDAAAAAEEMVATIGAVVVLRGTWDASEGTFPGGGTARNGYSWIVSAAGDVDGVVFDIGDRIIATTDNASTDTFAGNWFKADYTDQVLLVNGKKGNVVLGIADLPDAGPLVDLAAATPVNGRFLRGNGTGWDVVTPGVVRDGLGVGTGQSPQFAGANIGHASDTLLGRAEAGVLTVAGIRAALLGREGQSIEGGAGVVVKDLGNLSGQTITINPNLRPAQKITNNGAGTIKAHTTVFGAGRLLIVNTSGAGIATIEDFDDVIGDSLDTTNGSIFLGAYDIWPDYKLLYIRKKA